MIAGKEVEDVNNFVYLGATVSSTGGTKEDKRRRLGHARTAFYKLSKIWNNDQISRKTKIKLFQSDVISILLYGCETRKMTKGDERHLLVVIFLVNQMCLLDTINAPSCQIKNMFIFVWL